ncbi:MAG: M36 family metallopeptidase [Verrucomicrobia bacterium]|nr:M36 family metallopeptidase [Verrucomicrobiota bacterium]
MDHLHARVPRARVEFDPVVGSPKSVAASDGFLSGPRGEGRGISKAAADAFKADDPHHATKAFLQEHRALFGHGSEALDTAPVKREFVTPHNGLRTVVWQQQVDGLDVFEAVLIAHTTKHGELVNLSSQFVPAPTEAADKGLPNRKLLQAAPPISAPRAVASAAQIVGDEVTEDQLTPVDSADEPTGEFRTERRLERSSSETQSALRPDSARKFKAAGLKGESTARLVWLPLDREELRLCWDVLLTSGSRGEMFRVLVDAATGEVWLRRCLTEYLTNASYRVFTSDSPSPFSPGHATPLTNQPPLTARSLVTLAAWNTNASPNGWIDDGVNETLGNNVDAHTDRDANNSPDLPRPSGSPFRTFDFPMDLTSQHPTNYSAAAVVQLFYYCNWMHDRLYELGFTEAAGNFQATNFGRGGLGNDRLLADAQDGGGSNNANMSTPSDGSSPRMQVYLYNAAQPWRDGDLDAEIVLHEYTHGLSHRRVGGGVGLSATQSRGMGEGWSDFYALAMLSEAADDPTACYAKGGYAAYRPTSGFLESYYYGVRRYPYTTDLTKNPLTFKDIDPAQADNCSSGAPFSPRFGSCTAIDAAEVHNAGEVWCVTLWEARANLIAKHGFAVGNDLILQLVTDGMNLSPANPNFLQARDAILQADQLSHGGANQAALWAAFAKRGLGVGATSPSSSTTTGVRESFDVPDDLRVSPATGFTSRGPVGGPFAPTATTFALVNLGSNLVDWAAACTANWLNLSPTSGTLAAGASNFVTVSLDPSASSLAAGDYTGTAQFTNTASGMVQSRSFVLRVGQPDYFTEFFNTGDNDLDYQTLTFTPDGSTSFYSVCREPAFAFPTDPATSTNISMASDSYYTLSLPPGTNVLLYGRATNVLYVGSAGYITLNAGDLTAPSNFTNHFRLPRFAALSTHCHPSDGGTISWQRLSNRVAVTFRNVREYGTANTNSFQFEMFFDGRLRLTYLALGTTNGLAGLSAGTGLPPDFLESDLSNYDPCVLPLRLSVPAVAMEGDGVLPGQGRVDLLVPPTNDVTVNLSSSDLSEVAAPPSVTLLAGQTNASFDLTILDDPDLDGAQVAQITASAPGYGTATASIQVTDNETATLSVGLPAQVREGDGPVQGTVSASAAPTANIVVGLMSSDTTELQVPPSAVLLAGQTSAVFNVTVVNDTLIDGDQMATVTAHVPNWTEGSANLVVQDNEPTNLVVVLPASAREGNGVLAGAGAVRIAGTLPTNLVVALASSDPTELTVPPTTTIFAGQTNGAFSLTIVDDPDIDSSQTVTVTASAADFADGAATLTVSDDESPPEPSNPSPAHWATNVIQTADLLWQSGAMPGEIITNEIYFGTNPTPGPAELLGSTTSTTWSLPTLAPLTTYYWQIVARKTGVTPGPVWQFTTRGVDHFVWDPIPGTQFVGAPFPVTVTAKDAFETTVSNFTGTVSFSSSGRGQVITNMILGNVVPVGSSSGIYTLGFGFTPNTNLTVTHVRSCSGTKVSLWRTNGVLLASQNVSGPEGIWTETSLASPVVLSGGETYCVSFFTAGGAYYYRANRPTTFPNGTIANGYYYSSADSFPSDFHSADTHIYLCDLRYTVGSSADGPIAPLVSGTFAEGAWSGSLAALAPTTDLVLRADDGNGHIGQSNPFAVELRNDLAVSITDSPDPVSPGGTVTCTITVTNIGPADASGVVVINWLPPTVEFVSATASQGSVTAIDQLVVGSLGTLSDGAVATITFVARALGVDLFTNWVWVSRAEADAYPDNNWADATTAVQTPAISINDASVFEGNTGTVSGTFTVTVSPAPALTTTVNFATASGTATEGLDFLGGSGVLTFAPGETTLLVPITILGDTLYESNETFFVNLSGAVNASLADSQGLGTIRNDDPMPRLSIGDVTVVEGNVGTTGAVFTVSLSAPSGLGVTGTYGTTSGNASSGSDYASRSGNVNISAGSTNAEILVPVNGDMQIETDEVFYVDLSSVGNAILLKREGVGLILNDDGLPGAVDHFTWSAIPSPQAVGQPFGVTLTALDVFNEPAVHFTGPAYLSVAGGAGTTNILGTDTATAGVPIYTGYATARTQVIYPASEVGGAGRIEALALDVASLPGITLNNWTIRLKPTPLTNHTSYVWESTNWTVVYQTNLSVTATGWVVFPLATRFEYDGTNSLMVDFSFYNSASYAAGSCRVTLRSTTRTLYYCTSSYGNPLTWSGSYPSPTSGGFTPNLLLIRGGERANLHPLAAGPFTNGLWSGDLTVLDVATNRVLRADDGLGHAGMSGPFSVELRDDLGLVVANSLDPVAVGANLTYTVLVTNTGPAAATGVVVTNLLPPTAALLSVTLSQGAHDTFGQAVVCSLGTINGNSAATVTLLVSPTALGVLTNVAFVTRAEADGYDANNAATNHTTVSVPILAINNASVWEGNSGQAALAFAVRLLPASPLPVTVNFATSNGTAQAGSDYLAASGLLTFLPGETNQFVTVTILGDTNGEPNETLTVGLTNPTNAVLGVATATGTILNDDIPVAQMPFVEDWESGRFEPYWKVTGTGNYRSQVTSVNGPRAGAYHLTMDTVSGYARNEVTLTINLAGWTNVWMRFYGRDWDDDSHGPPPIPFYGGADFDGVAISTNSNAWYEVRGLRDLTSAYVAYQVDLDAALRTRGLSYTPFFYIRFNQYDDNPISTDGIGIDDIEITGVMRDDLQVSPADELVASGYEGGPFDPSNKVYTVSNTGAANLNWSAGCTEPWVTVEPAGGNLAPGDATNVSVLFNASANSLSNGTHTASVIFSNLTTGVAQTRDVRLTVLELPQPPPVPFGPVPTNLATGVSVHTRLSWNEASAAEGSSSGIACYPLGGTNNTFSGINRLRANIVTVSNTQTLAEIKMELSFTGTLDVYYYVLQATNTSGPYTPVFWKIVPQTGIGHSLYSSGPLQHELYPGSYYAIGGAWGNSNVEYARQAATFPAAWPSGTAFGALAADTAPPYPGLVSGFSTSGLYAMELCFEANASPRYDVWLGTGPTSLNRLATNLTQATLDPGPLAFGTTYYWQVVASNATGGVTTGAVWHFTTALDEVHFASATASIAENAGAATIMVVRENPAGGALSIHYATADGTAQAGSDYTAVSGTLEFPAGVLSTNFQVPILDDSASEVNETVLLQLYRPSTNVFLAAPSNAVLTIVDNDAVQVSLFFDPAYVDTSNSTDDEATNVIAALTARGCQVRTFTGTSTAAFSNALVGASILYIPDLENGDLASVLSASAMSVISNFVAGGGRLIINGQDGTRDESFINRVFGHTIVRASWSSTTWLTGAAAGTTFVGGPASLPNNDGTYVWLRSSLPAGSLSIYQDGEAAYTSVAVIPRGAGRIVFLAYDWYNAFPRGTQNGGWDEVLRRAVLETGTLSPPLITTQPQSRTVVLGATAAFDVAVSGSQPLFYQWRKDGTNLLDDGRLSGTLSNRLTIANVQTNDAGLYSVVVTNLAGAALSSNAALTVDAPPPPQPPCCPTPPHAATLVSFTTMLSWDDGRSNRWSAVDLGPTNLTPYTSLIGGSQDRSVTVRANRSCQVSSLAIKARVGAATALGVNVRTVSGTTRGAILAAAGQGIPAGPLDFVEMPMTLSFEAGQLYDIAFNVTGGWGSGQHEIEFYGFDNPALNPTLGFGAGPFTVLDGASGGAFSNTLLPHVRIAGYMGTGFTTFSVLFGTNQSALSLIVTNSASTACDPGLLAFGTTYFWQVVASNAAGSVTGAVWQFTTALDRVHFATADTSVAEKGGTAAITVVRENPASGALSVQYATADGTATASSDYTAVSGTLEFPAGVWSTNFLVPILDDAVAETNETILLQLTHPSTNVALIAPSNATLTVVDDDTVSVSLFYDPAYVDTCTDGSWCEGTNVLAALLAKGCQVRTFTGTNAGAFSNALLGASVLYIPWLENRALAPALSASAKSVISNFVAGGGKLVLNGDMNANRAGDLVNRVFGYSIASALWSTPPLLADAAHGTAFDGGPAILLSYPGSTFPWLKSSLPPGGRSIYQDSGGSYTTVAVIPQGAGSIVFLAFLWSDAVPRGSRDGGWDEVLRRAVLGTSTAAPPTITAQPESRTIRVGQPAAFTVGATGALPLNYQWRKGTSLLAFQTNATLTIPIIQPTDTGTYSVIVSNAPGSVSSSNVTLLVKTNSQLVVGIGATGAVEERNALATTLSGLGFFVRPVSQNQWTGLDVVVNYPGSSVSSPTAPEIYNGASAVHIGDVGSLAILAEGDGVSIRLDTAHPITAGLPATWISHGYWRYGYTGWDYLSWSTDTALLSLASAVSPTNHARLLVADSIGSGRAVYIGWNVYGPDAGPNDLTVLRQAILWAAGVLTDTPLDLVAEDCRVSTNGLFSFTLRSQPATTVIEVSTNLTTWTPLQTNDLNAGPLHFHDAASGTQAVRFYRARTER